jgi:DNA-binding transcriptional ArsR family regulator
LELAVGGEIQRGKIKMDDALEALVVGKKKLDRKLVADILSPYVRLDKDACNISPLEGWLGLGTDLKILVYLLARKAMVLLRFGLEGEGAIVSEIARDTDLKLSTVTSVLRKMYAEGILDRAKDRRYFVPNDAVERVRERFRRQNI